MGSPAAQRWQTEVIDSVVDMGILALVVLALVPSQAIFFREDSHEFKEDKDFFQGNFGVDGEGF